MFPAAVLTRLAQGEDVTQSIPADIIGTWLGYGGVGVLFLMVILRWKIQPTYVMENAEKVWERDRARLLQENAELKEALKESNAFFQTDVIPMMTLNVERTQQWMEVIEQLRRGRG